MQKGQNVTRPAFAAIALLSAGSAMAFPSASAPQLVSPAPSTLPGESADPIAWGSHALFAIAAGPALRAVRSDDWNATWTTMRLDDGSATATIQPRLAVNGSAVVAVWQQWPGPHIVMRHSTDNGRAWSPLRSIALGHDPQVAFTAAGLSIAYRTLDANAVAAVITSLDGGESWGLPTLFPRAGFAQELSIARDASGTVALAWEQWPNARARWAALATSRDSGRTYTTQNLTPTWHSAREPLVATAFGQWYVYLRNDSHLTAADPNGDGTLFTSRDLSTWTHSVVNVNSRQGSPLAWGTNVAVLALEGCSDGWHVTLRHSTTYGATWEAPRDLSGPAGYPIPLPDDVYLPSMSLWNQTLSVSYVTQGAIAVRSTNNLSSYISAPLVVGHGTQPSVAGPDVLWLNSGAAYAAALH